jgi:hypothetical protein
LIERERSVTGLTTGFYGPWHNRVLRQYDMNRRSQMQGGKIWILPKEINANQFFGDSYWLEIWQNHLCPSMGPKSPFNF